MESLTSLQHTGSPGSPSSPSSPRRLGVRPHRLGVLPEARLDLRSNVTKHDWTYDNERLGFLDGIVLMGAEEDEATVDMSCPKDARKKMIWVPHF